MTHEQFNATVRRFFADVGDEIERKNADYAGESPSAFAAFDEAASVLGLTREQVWAVFYMKHVQALVRFIKQGKLDSEDITSRLTDLAAYPAIFAAMLEDEKKSPIGDAIVEAMRTAQIHTVSPENRMFSTYHGG